MLSRVIGRLGTRVKPWCKKQFSGCRYPAGNSFSTINGAFRARACSTIAEAKVLALEACEFFESSRRPSPTGQPTIKVLTFRSRGHTRRAESTIALILE